MISELNKDKAALTKDIGLLASQIKVKRIELQSLADDIARAREILLQEKARLEPTLSHAADVVRKAEQRVKDLEQNYEHIKKLNEAELLSMKNKLSALQGQYSVLQGRIDIEKEKLKGITDEAEVAFKKLNFLKEQIPALEKEAEEDKVLVDKLVYLSKRLMDQVHDLEQKEATLTKSIEKMQDEQMSLDKFHEELKQRSKDLDSREEELGVIAKKAAFMFEKSAEEIHLPIRGLPES